MLKRVAAILLIFLMFFQSFEKISIFIYYQTYQEYIATYLCENRFRPTSNCNGQCYLMKKLRKVEERKSTPVVPDNHKSDFLIEKIVEQNKVSDSAVIIKILKSEIWIEKEYQSGIFRPPKG